MVDLLVELLKAFWILIPAYAANGFPPLAKGKHPMDFGRKFFDGRRLLGDGKTFEGFTLGLIAGTAYGMLETILYPSINAYANLYGVSFPYMSVIIGFMIALGALCGDLAGSFVKRRLRMPRGADAPLLDQLNFVVGAIVFAYAFTQISLAMILIMLVITPIIHRFVCIIGHLLKLKQVPW